LVWFIARAVEHRVLETMKINSAVGLSLVAALVSPAVTVNAADAYVNAPDGSTISEFEAPLSLTSTDVDNQGLTLAGRRALIDLVDASGGARSFYSSDPDWSDFAVLNGSPSYSLFKYLSGNTTISGDYSFDPGTGNNPVFVDLGEYALDIEGNLDSQGVHFLTTVNSNASVDGLLMDENTLFSANTFDVDESTTGRVRAGEFLEQTSGLAASMKIILDLNSTLMNGADFVFAQEDSGTASNLFAFDVLEETNSTLFDTSYVINSSAARVIENNNERIVITFQRDDNEYITKSYTDNHPSNDAALKLGTIAARGVALGDMQTALTRLDVNDFGYGNTAENLAVEVKRLAPIVNNSLLISQFDAVRLVTDETTYRVESRRGNWSGNSERDQSLWLKAINGTTNSSGSVPVATPTAQDTAGHDGFETDISGFVLGYDKTFKNGVLGLSMAQVRSELNQMDDRLGERSTIDQRVWSLYGQVHSKTDFVNLSLKSSANDVTGLRKTAIDRVSLYEYDSKTTEMALKYGHRFDLSDGRSALTPYARFIKSRNTTPSYTETNAGDLSLNVHERVIDKETLELGLSASHKGRFAGIKALTVLRAAVGKDIDISDLTVSANYTGPTDASYLSFTAPAEEWAENYVSLGADLQLEAREGVMFKFGANGEMRQGRQNYSANLSAIWTF